MSCDPCFKTDRDATAVLVCLSCRHARATGFVACSLSGRPLVHDAAKGERLRALAAFPAPHAGRGCAGGACGVPRGCPVGRAPDADGRVRWLGIRWRGVPWLLRQVMADEVASAYWLGLPKTVALDDVPGCGCIDRIKAWTTRWVGRMFGWSP